MADSAPQHEAGTTPSVVLHDTVVSVTVTSSSSYPYTPINMVDRETGFNAKKHVLPPSIVPVEVALCPSLKQTYLSMTQWGQVPWLDGSFSSP